MDFKKQHGVETQSVAVESHKALSNVGAESNRMAQSLLLQASPKGIVWGNVGSDRFSPGVD